MTVYQYESSTNGALAIIIADLNSNQLNDFDPIVIGGRLAEYTHQARRATFHVPFVVIAWKRCLVPVHSMYTKDLPIVTLNMK